MNVIIMVQVRVTSEVLTSQDLISPCNFKMDVTILPLTHQDLSFQVTLPRDLQSTDIARPHIPLQLQDVTILPLTHLRLTQ